MLFQHAACQRCRASPNVAKKTCRALYRQEVVECSRRRKSNRMSQTSELEAAGEPSPISNTSSEKGAPSISSTSQSMPTRLARPQRRWKRAGIWNVWLVGILLGIVLIASLLGHFFLVNPQTGAILTSNFGGKSASVVDTVSTTKTVQTLGLPGSAQFGVAIDQFTNLAVIVDQANNRVLLFPIPH